MNKNSFKIPYLLPLLFVLFFTGHASAQVESPAKSPVENSLEEEILLEMEALTAGTDEVENPELSEMPPQEAQPLAGEGNSEEASNEAIDTVAAAEAEAPVSIESLDPKIQDLKEEILELNTLLFRLQEELLFPEESSVTVFLSVEGSHYFTLDAIKLHIDDKLVASALYTDREVMALKKGGVQRLYTGNIRSGEHQLLVVFNGIGPQSLDYKRAESITIQKGKAATFIKLIVRDNLDLKQPKFTYETW